MRRVRQDRFDGCVQACVASILDLDLEDVPAFGCETWTEELASWLLNRGWCYVNVRFDQDIPGIPAGFTLAGIPAGPAFPEDWEHCIVCLNGDPVWDPMGSLNGTGRPHSYLIMYPLRPALGDL